jgi:putative peptidoglycan lipid II flippase
LTAGPRAEPADGSVRALGTAAAGLAAIAAIGQAFVVLREVYAAAEAGTSAGIDALMVALVAPTIVVSLLSSSTQAALVPALIDVDARRGREAARRLAGTSVCATVGIGLLVAPLILASAEPTIAIAGPGLGSEARRTALSFVPILLPLVIFAPAATLLVATCQVHGMFAAISASWVAGPVAAFLVTLTLWQQLGVGALALATTADALATFLVLVVALLVRRRLPWPGRGVQRGDLAGFARHAAPMTAGSSVLQLNLLTDRAVASLLSTGAVSALRYGERIVRTPISILFPAWSTAVYPTIARSAVDSDEAAFGRTASQALRYVIAAFMPISVATIALAPLIVAVAYERGAFDAAATATTAGVVAGFAPLILLWLVHPILNGAHNARRRGGFLARTALLNALLNGILNVVFGLVLGVTGVALSTSVTGWLLVAILARRLAQLEPDFELSGVLSVAGRSLAASLVPAVPIGVLAWLIHPALDFGLQLLLLAVATAAGAVGYLLVSRVLGLQEPWVAFFALRRLARARVARQA